MTTSPGDHRRLAEQALAELKPGFTSMDDLPELVNALVHATLAGPPDPPPAVADLFRRIKYIEESDGGWPGPDVVDVLTTWFTEQGFKVDADAALADVGSYAPMPDINPPMTETARLARRRGITDALDEWRGDYHDSEDALVCDKPLLGTLARFIDDRLAGGPLASDQ